MTPMERLVAWADDNQEVFFLLMFALLVAITLIGL